MATLLTLKHLAMLLISLFSGCSGPDSFELGYGHGWQHGQNAVHQFREFDTYEFNQGETSEVWCAFIWDLGPRQVEIVNYQATPSISYFSNWPQEPVKSEDAAPLDVDHPVTEHIADGVTKGVKAFDALDWVTRIILGLLAGWLAWIYREQISRWVPGTKANGKAKKK